MINKHNNVNGEDQPTLPYDEQAHHEAFL